MDNNALLSRDRIVVQVLFRMHMSLSTNEGNHICIMSEMSKKKNAEILLIEHEIRIVENPVVKREEGIIIKKCEWQARKCREKKKQVPPH